MTIHNSEKQCRNYCPICGGQDIEWSRIEDAEIPYQSGDCRECGCRFDELYKYTTTTFVKDKITSAEQLAKAAKAIVDDFDTYGEVLQADARSEYTPETSIEILRLAIKKYEEEQK